MFTVGSSREKTPAKMISPRLTAAMMMMGRCLYPWVSLSSSYMYVAARIHILEQQKYSVRKQRHQTQLQPLPSWLFTAFTASECLCSWTKNAADADGGCCCVETKSRREENEKVRHGKKVNNRKATTASAAGKGGKQQRKGVSLHCRHL